MSKVFGICMVKNEEDIIGYVMEHMIAEGIDEFLIADNMSTDGTRDILEDLSRHHPSIHILDDTEVAYYQSRKMTTLVNKAAEMGADWIVPFDADEVWYAESGDLLADMLRDCSDPVVSADVWDHLPHVNDPVGDNPLTTILHREPNPEVLPCVAFRYEPNCVLLQGNHAVVRSGSHNYGRMAIRHFQYRSLEQFKSKLRTGKAAYDATDLPSGEGAHWREMGALSDEQLEAEWIAFTNQNLVYDPAPVRGQ